jgi:hypothetical protein
MDRRRPGNLASVPDSLLVLLEAGIALRVPCKMTCNGERTEEANVPEEGGLPTSQELQQPVTDWLQRWGGDGHPKCSVCGERWSASVAEGNVALQAVPHRRSTFKFSTWRGRTQNV